MALYLLDTNVLIRLVDATDPLHPLAVSATRHLIHNKHELRVNAQALIEFRAVATRPVPANGLGWEPSKTGNAVQGFLSNFAFIEDDARDFENWLMLVIAHGVRGKQVHDTRFAAAMLTHGVTDLLTFNDTDFKRFTSIKAWNPAEVVKAP